MKGTIILANEESGALRPEKSAQFDPNEFATAFRFAWNAVLCEAIISDPAEMKIMWNRGDGIIVTYQFQDTPEIRMKIALAERYADNMIKYYSACYRIEALIDIIHHPWLKQWIRLIGEYTYLHPAIIDAAAIARLDKDGNFKVREFLKTAQDLLLEKY